MFHFTLKWLFVFVVLNVTVAATEPTLSERAKQGEPDAQFSLGRRYANGDGVPKDSAEAVNWYRSAAEQGHVRAQSALGALYFRGDGVPKNSTESMRWFRKAAQQGDVLAQVILGLIYAEGTSGVLKDSVEAANWFRKAAEQGNALAQGKLGQCYQYGWGVDRDYNQSLKWLRLAVEQGDPHAMFVLGMHYVFGQGVAQDAQQALNFIRQAAERGDGAAQVMLGYALKSGFLNLNHSLVVEKNLPEAFKWFRTAAEQGNAQGQEGLGDMYAEGEAVQKDGAEAVKWYRKAAEQGWSLAQHSLGQIYRSGELVQKDGSEAVHWFRKACETSAFPSAESLGFMYGEGDGVPKDEIEGLAWTYIAAASGPQSSIQNREILERRLGRQISLLAQQRSKEILKEIETAKRNSSTHVAKGSTGHFVPDSDMPKASGSGAIVSTQGYVLTAAHVVVGATKVKIHTAQGLRSATVLRVDEGNDIAVLKLDNGTYPALPIALSRKVRLGQTVATIGFPNIGFQGFSPKVTKGEISSLNGFGDDPRAWQISVPVQPGSSGGALLDENGNLIGVVVSKLGLRAVKETGDIPQNVNYAVKSSYALALLEPYLDGSASEPNTVATKPRFEDMIAKAQQSVVLILVY